MMALPTMASIMWKKFRTVQGAIVGALTVTLIIGLFLGSPVGRIVCGAGLVGLAVFVTLALRQELSFPPRDKRASETSLEEVNPQPDRADMKKLLFDDFQPPSAQGYVVKEIADEGNVVPSTKSAQRVVLTQEQKSREFNVTDFYDLEFDVLQTDVEPRSEFNFILNKLLAAMKEVLFAHSVAFFWANREKLQLVLEARATDSENFMVTNRYPIGDDVASQVAQTGKPQVLGRISQQAEKELIRHYIGNEGIRSLIVVPVFYLRGTANEQPLPEGVIVVDSTAEDAFGPETLSTMAQFTKVVSALIKSYASKYDLLLDSELLASIRRLQDRAKAGRSEQAVLNALADEAVKLVSWEVMTVAMYSDEQRCWAIQKVVNRTNVAYPGVGTVVDFSDSVVGKAIRSNSLVSIADQEEEPIVRFSHSEAVYLQGSFLCIPISSLNRCYGAVTFESNARYHFNSTEIVALSRLIETAAQLLEVLYLNDLVKEHIAVDQLTGSLTKQHFLKKVEEEVHRADDTGAELSCVMLSVDDADRHIERLGSEGYESIVHHVAATLRASLHSYDVMGRLDAHTLGVLLINTPGSDGYLWAEKVRKLIASNIFSVNGVTCSVTVSAGVCGLTEGMTSEQFLADASQVLQKALESGGNLVRVF